MIRLLQFAIAALMLVLAVPYAYNVATASSAPAKETEIAEAAEASWNAPIAAATTPEIETATPEAEATPKAEAVIDPGTLTEIGGSHMRVRFQRADRDYEAPRFGFDEHVTPAGTTYYARMPEGIENPPLVVLLHGSNFDGRSMIDMWRRGTSDVLLIAPDALDIRRWSDTEDGAHFDEVLQHVSQAYAYDANRVYLYGDSSGANRALALAASPTAPWRAVAVHAGAPRGLRPDPHEDAIPIRIQVGTDNRRITPDDARVTADEFLAGGHDVELVIIPDHDNWLFALGPQLARDAWAFLSAH